MKKLTSGLVIIALLALCTGIANAQAISFQNKYVKLNIEKDGRVSGLFDRTSGKNHAISPAGYIAGIKQNDTVLTVNSAVKTKDGLLLGFANTSTTANIKVTVKPNYLVFEVSSVSDNTIQEFTFLDIKLIHQTNTSPFSWAAISMNLHTNVPALPGIGDSLLATCVSQFGIKGAKVGIIGSPSSKMRSIMKEVVYAAKDSVPYSPYGGPWAMDIKSIKGSYIVDCNQMRDDTVDKWIKICSDTGIHQIDFSNWNFFVGEYEVNPKFIPGGKAELKRVIKRLKAAGIRCGLHTYSFLIGRESKKYVSPIPDPRLLKGAKFTLTADVNDTDTSISVEPGLDFNRIGPGVIVQIDNELISLGDFSKTSPLTITGCTRGFLETRPSSHKTGSTVAELRQVFAVFMPDVHTTIYKEIAGNLARTANEYGFDMMYLDAIDSYFSLDTPENGWYWATLFVNEIVKKVKQPVMLEGSTFWHGLWFARSRIGAWDVPVRAEKECYDAHFVDNLFYQKTFMPTHLGWCDVRKWSPVQPERTFDDDIEFLLCKSMAADCGMSMQAYLNPDNYMKSENAQRIGKLIGKYERLRTKNYFPESIRKKLAISGADYTLEQANNKWFFRPVTYAKHKVNGYDRSTYTWSVNNKYTSQPAQVRIEALMSIDPYDSPEAKVQIDGSNEKLPKIDQIQGVKSSSLTAGAFPELGRPEPLVCFKATASDPMSWVGSTTRLIYGIDGSMKGFGFWVYGDGLGEIVNIQTTSVPSSTGYSDHYVKVDFTGWKYFELVEPETTEMSKYDWPTVSKKTEWAYTENGPSVHKMRIPPSSTAYTVYVMYGAINYVTLMGIWYNNLPVGKEVTTYLSPIKALPLKYAKIVNPSIEIAGKTITFPVTLESGQYIEYRSTKDCKVYNADGAVIANLKPTGTIPIAKSGSNKATFNCKTTGDLNPRLTITIITKGNPITK